MKRNLGSGRTNSTARRITVGGRMTIGGRLSFVAG
jgi:hypothetical protein